MFAAAWLARLMESIMTSTAINIEARDYRPVFLKDVLNALRETLDGLGQKYVAPTEPRKKLLDDLRGRHGEARRNIEAGKYPQAFEILYGITLGVDGLGSRWGLTRSVVDEDDAEDPGFRDCI